MEENGFLTIDNLSKHFGELKAVDKVSFSVDQGTIRGLIGPNGAGKTTLINLITGRLDKTTGSVYYKGEDISDLSPYQVAQLGIGRTFQVTKPLTDMNVEESALTGALFGKATGLVGVQEARERAREFLEFTGMLDKKDQQVTELTVADQRRLQFTQTLAMSSEMLLLDELMAGLNPNEVEEMLDLIQSIKEELDLTILFIEHVMQAVMTISESIVVIDHGQKIAEGTPEEISDDPEVIEAYLGKRYREGVNQ